MQASNLQGFATEAITVDDTSGGVRLTASNVIATPPAKTALITVESAQIRWLDDGTAPTSTTGHVANPTDVIALDNVGRLFTFRAIRTGASSATIRVSYYR